MDFDFNWILVPVTLVFFVVWLLDKLVFKQDAVRKAKLEQLKRAEQEVNVKAEQLSQQQSEQAQDALSQAQLKQVQAQSAVNEYKLNPIVGWAYDFWPILAVVLVIRSFLFEPFNIPSESMNPTLETGDFILVNKYAYGIKLPLINSKIIDTGEPQHGDVAVFRYPVKPSISFIKRIIGLPGDTIEFNRGVLSVNGQPLPYTVVKNDVSLPVRISKDTAVPVIATQWQVTFGQHQFLSQYIQPNQPEPIAEQIVNIMNNNQANPPFNQLSHEGQFLPLSLNQSWKITVPQGQYFAMGDNRDQSDDSRYWGFVPEANLTGKAVYVWMHKAPGLHLPSFSRNGLIP